DEILAPIPDPPDIPLLDLQRFLPEGARVDREHLVADQGHAAEIHQPSELLRDRERITPADSVAEGAERGRRFDPDLDVDEVPVRIDGGGLRDGDAARVTRREADHADRLDRRIELERNPGEVEGRVPRGDDDL